MRMRRFVLLAAIPAAGLAALAVFLAALIGLQAGAELRARSWCLLEGRV